VEAAPGKHNDGPVPASLVKHLPQRLTFHALQNIFVITVGEYNFGIGIYRRVPGNLVRDTIRTAFFEEKTEFFHRKHSRIPEGIDISGKHHAALHVSDLRISSFQTGQIFIISDVKNDAVPACRRLYLGEIIIQVKILPPMKMVSAVSFFLKKPKAILSLRTILYIYFYSYRDIPD
jgi:hypothetical protein